MKLPSRWWSDLTTRQFSELDMARVVALQPVAAVEQHGPHLPVNVDATINAGIVARALETMPDALPVLVLPALAVGKSNEHLAYPGTLSLSYETLARLWTEIGESVHRAGCRKIVYFNSHGGQTQVMDIVCRELRVRMGMLAVACSWFRITDTGDLFADAEERHGIHGGEAETSMMLHLQPQLVDMARAGNFVAASVRLEQDNALLVPNSRINYGWQTQDLHPSGACGNAAAADAGRGKIVVDRAATALVTLLREAEAFPLASLAARTAYSAER